MNIQEIDPKYIPTALLLAEPIPNELKEIKKLPDLFIWMAKNKMACFMEAIGHEIGFQNSNRNLCPRKHGPPSCSGRTRRHPETS